MSGREKTQRVPPLPPRVADPLVRVEDHEREIPLREVVTDRETGLAAAHDNRLDALTLAWTTHTTAHRRLL